MAMSKSEPGSIFEILGGRKLKGVLQVKDDLGFPRAKEFTSTDVSPKGRKALQKRMNEYWDTYASRTPGPHMKVRIVCELAIAECKRLKRAESTIEGYEEFLKWHISKTIGDIAIADLKPFHVEKMTELMKEGKTWTSRVEKGPKGTERTILQEPASSQTQLLCRNFLRSAINRVVIKNQIKDEKGFPLVNVAALAETEKVVHRKMPQLRPDAFDDILTKEPNEVLKALWLFLGETGVRPSEGRLVAWRPHLWEEEDGMWCQLTDSKSEMGKESFPISKRTAEAIKAIPRRSLYVFTTKGGTPFSERNVQKYWKRAVERAEVKYTNIYQIRHLFGSVKAKQVGDEILRRLMRHQDARTTKQFYVHAFDEDLRKAVEK